VTATDGAPSLPILDIRPLVEREAKELLALYDIPTVRERLATSADEASKVAAWRDMLENHARNVWSIGTVAGAPQPIVVRSGLENLPLRGDWAWEPTAMLGVYRIDELHWNRPPDGRAS